MRIKQWRAFDGCLLAFIFFYTLYRATAGQPLLPGVRPSYTVGALLLGLAALLALAVGTAALFQGDRSLLWELCPVGCILRLAVAFFAGCALFFHCLVLLPSLLPKSLPTLLDGWTNHRWSYVQPPSNVEQLENLSMTACLPRGIRPFSPSDLGFSAPRTQEIALRVDNGSLNRCALQLDFYSPRYVVVTYRPSPSLGRPPEPVLYYLLTPVDVDALPPPG